MSIGPERQGRLDICFYLPIDDIGRRLLRAVDQNYACFRSLLGDARDRFITKLRQPSRRSIFVHFRGYLCCLIDNNHIRG